MADRSGDETWSDPGTQFKTMQGREVPLRLPWLRERVRPGDRVLEIGSSSGFTLDVLRQWGCDVTGLELDPDYAAYAREQGIPTFGSWRELEEADPDPYDVVVHYYVLEHVTQPAEFLRDCMRWRRDDGTMIFEVPNANDPLTAFYDIPAFEQFYWWRAHHWYYTPRSLGRVLDDVGRPYELHPGQRYDLSNHIHWLMTGKPGGRGKYSHLFSAETERAYAEDLKRAWLCDTIIAIVH